MRIQHNIAALNSYRQLGGNNNAVAKNLEKLSSGYKINKAGDDAAGLAISEKMRAQITGLETAQKNAQDGISLVQTAEGALTEVHSMLNRMAELATQSSNGTYDDSIDRANLQAEVDSLRDEINRISESTNFNGINLLDGSLGGAKVTTAQGDVLSTSAVIGGKQIGATDATGNIFELDAAAANVTGAGNAYVKINYVDENGATQSATVSFASHATDAKESGKNLAEAINSNKELRNVFKASFDDATGKITIEGKQTGANAKSKIKNVQAAMDPIGGIKDAGASVDGANAVLDLTNAGLKATSKIKLTLQDGTEVEYTYDDTNFKTLAHLNAELGKLGLEAKSTAGANDIAQANDLEIINKNTGFDAGVSIEIDKDANGNWAAADTKTPATNSSYVFGKISGLAEGVKREFELKFKDSQDTEKTFKFSVTGGATDAETFKNIEQAIQDAADANSEFTKAFGEVDVTVGEDGKITITSQEQGKNGQATIHGSITLATTDANKATGKTFDGTVTKGLDAGLNLKDKFNTMKDGDSITLGKHTYTYKAGATGDDGKTFGTFAALQAAAQQNGVLLQDISKAGDLSTVVAKSAAKTTFDFDGRIGADVIGGTIDFGGNKFRFVEAGTPAKVEAGIKNIEIAKNATAEEMAKALADAMNGVTTKADAKDENSADVSWKSSLQEGKSGKKTIVELEASPAGKVDVPKAKLTDFGINLQVGDTNEDYQKVRVSVDSMDATSLGIDKVDITNQTKAAESIKVIKDAINTVSAQRGKLGAVQNRLEHTINNLGVTTENITAAESRIRDTDMAKEMMAYTKNNILVQSAQAMLAQANTLPQGVLQLLQ